MDSTFKANNNMTLTKEQIEAITKEAIAKAELEEQGLAIMIPFMKYANTALFANAHYVKKADKATGKETHQTQLNVPLFLRLANKALESLGLDHKVESAWTGMLSYETYDPKRRDI